MTRPISTRTQRGLGSLLLAVALVFGVPGLLWAMAGWPFPRGIPRWTEVSRALEEGWHPEGSVLIRAVALCAWLAWAQVIASVLAELVAAIRSQPVARRVPLAAWCHPLAVRIATSLMIFLGSFGTRPVSADPLPMRAEAVVSAPFHGVSATVELRAEASLGAPLGHAVPAAGTMTHTVRPGDTLWDLAEHYLGSGYRWRELEALNRDQIQPDGRRLVDPGLLRPGWNLKLPGEARHVAAGTPGPVAGPEQAPADERARPASGGTQAEPLLPSRVAPSAGEEKPPSPPVASAVAASEPAAESPLDVGTVAAIGVPSLVAGAFIGYLGRLQRDRQRWRRIGADFPAPPSETQAVERVVRAAADPDATAMVDQGLRHLAVSLQEGDAPPVPEVLAVRGGPLGLEVLVSPPWPVTPGAFVPADDGHCWRLPATEPFPDAPECPAPIPALVTAGETQDGPLLIDLAAAGTLSVDGDSERVAGVLWSLIVELAAAPWADEVEVWLLGGPPEAANLPRIRILGVDEALQRLGTTQARPGTSYLRAVVDDDPPATPVVVIALPGVLDPEQAAALSAAALPHSGMAFVAADLPATHWRIEAGADGSGVLQPLGVPLICKADAGPLRVLLDELAQTAVRPEEHDEHEGDAPIVGDLSDDSDVDPPADGEVASPDGASNEEAGEPSTANGEHPARHVLVEVRVMGPVEVDWPGAPPRPKSEEAVVFLATHPGSVPSDRLRLALWPLDQDDERFGERSDTTLWSNVSRARAALGKDARGADLLGRAEGNAYRLTAAVDCDWTRFQRLVAAAKRNPADAIELLSAALTLVRGRPFDAVPKDQYAWVALERLDCEIEGAVISAASKLVDLALAAQDADLAHEAVRCGLLAAPDSEALCRCAMRVAAAQGDREGIERAWKGACRTARSLDPLGEPEPETARLRAELLSQFGGP